MSGSGGTGWLAVPLERDIAIKVEGGRESNRAELTPRCGTGVYKVDCRLEVDGNGLERSIGQIAAIRELIFNPTARKGRREVVEPRLSTFWTGFLPGLV